MLTGYRFQPRLAPSVLTGVLLGAFVALGFWQLDRAGEKREIQARFEARARMPPVELSGARLEPEAWDFREVTVRGEYENEYQVFLDNKVYRAQAGYHVLTPLRITGSQMRILVNRGWVAWGTDRRQLPEVPVVSGEVSLGGRLRKPQTGSFTLEKQAPTAFVPVWQELELGRYAEVAGIPVLPMVLQLAPEAADRAGLVRSWPQYRDTWIERHHGYALQWFALAVALVVIYFAVNIRRPGGEQRKV
ncbi:MAG: SURF1 family protein [Gammaproteobacteria bacterium]|nr:SURF1 family protein [Gammaproteobacteria bacterium]